MHKFSIQNVETNDGKDTQIESLKEWFMSILTIFTIFTTSMSDMLQISTRVQNLNDKLFN